MKMPWNYSYGYHVTMWLGRRRRGRFAARLASGCFARSPLPTTDLRLVSMAGKSSLPEMARSILSFSRHVRAQPVEWLVVSDGSLDGADAGRLKALCPSVRVATLAEVIRSDVPAIIASRAEASWLYRKLAVLMSVGREGPVLFADSDVLFFPASVGLTEHLRTLGATPAYMLDCSFKHDERMLEPADRDRPSVNSGLLYLTPSLDWTAAVRAVEQQPLDAEPHWTDQTASHLAMHASGAMMLHPDRFVLTVEDQFSWGDRAARCADVICRHYVGDVRHKMWMLPTA